MMREILTIAALALVIPTTAYATRWVPVAKSPDSVRFVDADAFIFDEATATIWLKTEYAGKGKSGEAVSIEKWLHDCAHGRAKLLALTLYKADGNVISSAEMPRYRQEWDAIKSGSIGERIHQRICGIVNGPAERRDAENIQFESIS
jgi:hypothetical protein